MTDKQLIINRSHSETRIALLENNRLCELLTQRRGEKKLVGNIYKGVVTRVLKGMNCAFVDIGVQKAAFLYGGDLFEDSSVSSLKEHEPVTDVHKLLSDGKQILVQLSKEAINTKGPRVTMNISLPGRYLVFMPFKSQHSISRKIEEEDERNRLQTIGENFSKNFQAGVIFRTNACYVNEELLLEDLKELNQRWLSISSKITALPAPSLLYSEWGLVERSLRDLYTKEISSIVIDELETYAKVSEILVSIDPKAKEKIHFYEEKMPIFDVYGIEVDISRALHKKIELPSGGYLIIEQTEALTTFDVNTGKYVGNINPRHTILKTNKEAVIKVVEQLRLRNIGGIIVIDFIDMENISDRKEIYNLFLQELKFDRAPTNVLEISELGLVQMTRKRIYESLEHQMLEPCHLCEGRGRLKTIITESYDLIREVIRVSLQTGQKNIRVKLRPDIKKWLLTEEKDFLDKINATHEITLEFVDSDLTLDLLRESAFEVL